MKLEDDAPPIHENAEVKVRPRIFFQGNLFMDLRPGTPASPEADSGDTSPPRRPRHRGRPTRTWGAPDQHAKDLQKLRSGTATR